MPRRLLARCHPDSIREFRAAARERYTDGLELAGRGRRTGAIYLWGYAAEMTLKAAYFSLLGSAEAEELDWGRHLRPAIQRGRGLGIPWPGRGEGHNVRAWAELLVRARLVPPATAYPVPFGRRSSGAVSGSNTCGARRSGTARTTPTSTRSGRSAKQPSGCWPTPTPCEGRPMPRKRRGFEEAARPARGDLAERLADELRRNSESGQPVIEEQTFPSGLIRTTVIWDAWDALPQDQRTSVILQAYELAEGPAYRDKVALASGLTVPEAHAAGMLPFRVFPAVRPNDPVTAEQCRTAMVEEGGSTLTGSQDPQLRFATGEDAEAARQRLARRLPGSDPVWLVTQEVVGRFDGWVES